MNIWNYFEHIAKEQHKDIDLDLLKEHFLEECGNALEPILEHFKVGESDSRFPDLISFFKSCENFADNTKDPFSDLGEFYPEFKDHEFLKKYYDEHKKFLIFFNEEMAKNCSMNLSEFFSNYVQDYDKQDLSVLLLKNPINPKIKEQLIFNYFSQEILRINEISRKEAIDDFPVFQEKFLKDHVSGYELFNQKAHQNSQMNKNKKLI